jgi:hypothetical protein
VSWGCSGGGGVPRPFLLGKGVAGGGRFGEQQRVGRWPGSYIAQELMALKWLTDPSLDLTINW